MTRRTDFLHRPPFGWRLIVYPLIVIPIMVYFNAGPVADKDGGILKPTSVNGRKVTELEPLVSAPVQGVTGNGRAYVLERDPNYPLLRFEMRLAQPNTIVDERRGGM